MRASTQILAVASLDDATHGAIRLAIRARLLLLAAGVSKHPVQPRVLMAGFSAPGVFTNRFAVLHPERVFAAAVGGPDGWPIAPVRADQGEMLPYPVGIADIEELSGSPSISMHSSVSASYSRRTIASRKRPPRLLSGPGGFQFLLLHAIAPLRAVGARRQFTRGLGVTVRHGRRRPDRLLSSGGRGRGGGAPEPWHGGVPPA